MGIGGTKCREVLEQILQGVRIVSITSSINPFSGLVARLYLLAICLVTAFRSAMDKPTGYLLRAAFASGPVRGHP